MKSLEDALNEAGWEDYYPHMDTVTHFDSSERQEQYKVIRRVKQPEKRTYWLRLSANPHAASEDWYLNEEYQVTPDQAKLIAAAIEALMEYVTAPQMINETHIVGPAITAFNALKEE